MKEFLTALLLTVTSPLWVPTVLVFGWIEKSIAEKPLCNPEYMSDGALVGYKWLKKRSSGGQMYWSSPVEGTLWNGNELTASKTPNMHWTSDSGIYVYYSEQTARRAIYGSDPYNYLVRLACDGKVVYHEAGARVEHAEIISVLGG